MSRNMISLRSLFSLDKSLIHLDLETLQCSLYSLAVQRPLGSIMFIMGSACSLVHSVKIMIS